MRSGRAATSCIMNGFKKKKKKERGVSLTWGEISFPSVRSHYVLLMMDLFPLLYKPLGVAIIVSLLCSEGLLFSKFFFVLPQCAFIFQTHNCHLSPAHIDVTA